jgi:transposase-like protein
MSCPELDFAEVPKYLIYGLADPRSGEIRYIGKSCSGLQRPKQHTRARGLALKTHNARWVKSLVEQGLEPVIEILDWRQDDSELGALEMQHIKQFRESGAKLTNITDGGDGGLAGVKHSLETKRKMSTSRGGADSELEKKVCDMYLGGASTAKIHKEIGVPRNSAWNILKRNGIEFRHRTAHRLKVNDDMRKKLAEMYMSNMSVVEISAAVGFSKSVINRALRKEIQESPETGLCMRNRVKETFSDEQKRDVIRKRQEGMTYAQLSSLFECSDKKIRNILKVLKKDIYEQL